MGAVLVVEDDDDLRTAICAALEEQGIASIGAANGAEALALLEHDALPTLILLDLMMPVMNGWGFRAQQEANPRLAGIPVIVMSAAPRLADAAIAGVDLVRKPVQLDDLIGRVRVQLDAREFDGVPPTIRDGAVLRSLDASDSDRTK